MTSGSTMLASTTPLPMVAATCRPNTVKAMKLKNDAHSTAVNGRNTRVDTTVAIELALSCSPLRKSNSSASRDQDDERRRADRAPSISAPRPARRRCRR